MSTVAQRLRQVHAGTEPPKAAFQIHLRTRRGLRVQPMAR
jgi:hypothetical protein